MQEIWKDIKGYEGHYQVSSLGRVKSVKHFSSLNKNRNKILSMHINRDNYVHVVLDKFNKSKRYPVHRIVATAFINQVNGKDIVNHKNGVITDNRVENLEWCNKKENMVHAMEVLGIKRDGDNNPNSKYTDEQIQELWELHRLGMSKYKAIKKLGIKQTTGYAIFNGIIRNNKNKI